MFRLHYSLHLLLSVFFCVAFLTHCASSQPASPTGTTEVQVTQNVLLHNPSRLGINLGKNTYYGDQQYVSNSFLHGGFHQGRQVNLVETAAGTPTSFQDAYADPADKDKFYTESFAGGTYTFATGPRAGESGAIIAHDVNTRTFTLDHSGPAPADREYVWVRGPQTSRALPDPAQGEKSVGVGDFRITADPSVAYDFVPGSEGPSDQALKISFPGEKEERLRGGIKHYIQATPDTQYRVIVRARADIPAEIGVSMENYGIPSGTPGSQIPMIDVEDNKLTGNWKDYVFEGHTFLSKQIADNFSTFNIIISADSSPGGGGDAFIDSVRLEDDRMKTDTGFNASVVNTLKEAHCGVIRFYNVADLGSLVESFTAKDTTESSWSYLSLQSGYRFNPTSAVLDEWMKLCQATGANPWITAGGANTPDDWYALISYLAAPASFDEHSQRRASHGFAKPWTEQFDTIYLELGNEWWNSLFRPYYVWSPEKYSELCNVIIKRIKSHPSFDEKKLKIIIGGWAVNGHHWNGIADAQTTGHDRISIAPYLVHELNDANTNEQKYGALFADVEGYAGVGGKSTLEDLAKNGKSTGRAVYELNTHITGGTASAKAASEIVTSVSAGVAVLDQAMAVMSVMQADPINYFTLLQRGLGFDEKKRLGLWGTVVRTPTGDLRPRPVWHGLRLANQYLIMGDMVAVEVKNSPTWDQKENGSVPALAKVPYIHAYAFSATDKRGKKMANILLVNRHRSLPLIAHITLPFNSTSAVHVVTLTGKSPDQNNEDSEEVTLKESNLDSYTPARTLVLPPFSATVYQFVEA